MDAERLLALVRLTFDAPFEQGEGDDAGDDIDSCAVSTAMGSIEPSRATSRSTT
jgi:hypothetical protein